MLISYEWLKTFFKEPLPSAEELASRLTLGAFEVEGVSKTGADHVFDVKVLPNRAHDCLSHRGVARELSSLLDVPLSRDPLSGDIPVFPESSGSVRVSVHDTSRCPIYCAAIMEDVKVGPSPAWLVERLSAVGQRSINNIVDATNYVMFELGTPLHVFDANKLSHDGVVSIGVRDAREGENIGILGGENLELSPAEMVITDTRSDTPIAIAGVKGGAHAELTGETSTIVIEAAKFHPVVTRRAAQRLQLRTDASKRFENEIADDLPLYGLRAVTALISDIAGGTLRDVDVVRRKAGAPFKLGVSAREVNRLLGTQLTLEDITRILVQLGLPYEVVQPQEKVLKVAQTLVGAQYKGDSAIRFDAPHTFSCSSLTNYLFVQVGIAMPSISIDQYVWGTPITREALAPGDLVFSNSNRGNIHYETKQFIPGTPVPEGIDHVGLYIGNNLVLHATRDPGRVVIEPLDESPSFRNTIGYRRVLDDTSPRAVVIVPFERLDLRIPADLIEEIGRVYGYEKIGIAALPEDAVSVPDNRFYYSERVRAALSALGFCEVSTYALREDGVVHLANPLASDKSTLRKDLRGALADVLARNEKQLPLLGGDTVRVFEIGNVFPEEEEEVLALAIGVYAPPGKHEDEVRASALALARSTVESALGVSVSFTETADIIECDLGAIADTLPAPETPYPPAPRVDVHAAYTPISAFPYLLRDIALWVPASVSASEVEALIRSVAGPLLSRVFLFDTFQKDDNISYAFHLVFQSHDKTLSDTDAQVLMEGITAALEGKGYHIR